VSELALTLKYHRHQLQLLMNEDRQRRRHHPYLRRRQQQPDNQLFDH
jgi:hypothetical protein